MRQRQREIFEGMMRRMVSWWAHSSAHYHDAICLFQNNGQGVAVQEFVDACLDDVIVDNASLFDMDDGK